MKALSILSELQFLESAKKAFGFPILNKVRTSFWIAGDTKTTPCQIETGNIQIEFENKDVVSISIVPRDFLEGKINVGVNFKIETYPTAIAIGTILEIQKIL
ncbi:hypothetical protein FMM05_16300 [Flavobacterium zepuense]|uniref:Uncharacterized protein n=1 Tax=Flavobacterium zepuense TaxID=2593302 RepID=A0A552UX75_9FLAO|nr:hypothetical protein [Flavobacterium zepuense]TRW22815.1 hypothetical protein FMM05_16300 [Flavobacterium zepuense]